MKIISISIRHNNDSIVSGDNGSGGNKDDGDGDGGNKWKNVALVMPKDGGTNGVGNFGGGRILVYTLWLVSS